MGTFLTWLIGGGINAITGQIAEAYKAKLAAANDAERIDADVRIATLEAQRDVMVAEAANGGLQSWIRPLFALPFVIFNMKVVVWDKVLGLGVTDPLSDELFQIEMIVISAYFLARASEKVARIVRKH